MSGNVAEISAGGGGPLLVMPLTRAVEFGYTTAVYDDPCWMVLAWDVSVEDWCPIAVGDRLLVEDADFDPEGVITVGERVVPAPSCFVPNQPVEVVYREESSSQDAGWVVPVAGDMLVHWQAAVFLDGDRVLSLGFGDE